jgi:hypothetical protein
MFWGAHLSVYVGMADPLTLGGRARKRPWFALRAAKRPRQAPAMAVGVDPKDEESISRTPVAQGVDFSGSVVARWQCLAVVPGHPPATTATLVVPSRDRRPRFE